MGRHEILKKLRTFLKRSQLDLDLEDELQFHLDMRAAANKSGPVVFRSPLGNTTLLKERCRELWTFPKLESWWRDMVHATRTLVSNPAFSLVAVIVLGLGIGADTAMFTIAKGAFSWNLGLEHADRTFLIGLASANGRQSLGVAYSDFRFLSDRATSFAGIAAYRFTSVNLSDNKSFPERYHCVSMSANGFVVSEQKPTMGREFAPEEERPGAPAVVILTHQVWQDRYGSDPAILGKRIRVDDVQRTVIGVMAPGKRFPEETDLWIPLNPTNQANSREQRDLTLFGRLPDGGKKRAALEELNAIAARLSEQYLAATKKLNATIDPIVEISGAYQVRPLFAALWFAVGFVLLIACADIANMLLARGAGRSREISIRLAIGAGRIQIVRQLLIESVVLSIAGGFFGWVIAKLGLLLFDHATGGLKPIWLQLSLDRNTFVYLALITLGAGILFGLAPAMKLARIDVYSTMKDGGQGIAGSRRVLSLSNALVVLQMVLCIVLVAGAGLMIRSVVNLYSTPMGADVANVLTMDINLPLAKYPSSREQIAFHRELKTALEAQAGVSTLAAVSNLPSGIRCNLLISLRALLSSLDTRFELADCSRPRLTFRSCT